MRKFYLFWILLVSVNFLYGQSAHFAEHRHLDQISGMVCVNQKSFYLERVDLQMYAVLNLVGVDGTGTPFLKKQLLSSSHYSLTTKRIIGTLDKQLACFYRSMQSCDVGGGTNYFSKLDTAGNFVFTSSLSAMPIDMVQYSDSSYYLIIGSELKHYSKNGLFISSYNFAGSSFRCLSRLNNGSLFLSSPTTYYEVDTAGNYVQVVPSNTSILKFVQTNSGNSFGLSSSGQLMRYSPSFSVINQSQLNGVTLTDFV